MEKTMGLEISPDFRITYEQLGAAADFVENSGAGSISLGVLLTLLQDHKKIFEMPVAEWTMQHNITVRARRAMQRLGIETVRDLIGHTEKELLSMSNCYRGSVNSIKAALAKSGLQLKPKTRKK